MPLLGRRKKKIAHVAPINTLPRREDSNLKRGQMINNRSNEQRLTNRIVKSSADAAEGEYRKMYQQTLSDLYQDNLRLQNENERLQNENERLQYLLQHLHHNQTIQRRSTRNLPRNSTRNLPRNSTRNLPQNWSPKYWSKQHVTWGR